MQLGIHDFETVKPISKGAFGVVYLCRHKSTGELYAVCIHPLWVCMRLDGNMLSMCMRLDMTHEWLDVYIHVLRMQHSHTHKHSIHTQVKVLKKEDVRRKNQFKYVKAEKSIMAAVDCPFVVHLYCSFQSRDYLYLVMEYVQGGDCYSLLQVPFRVFSGLYVHMYSRTYAIKTAR
jgi:serine/threonine protein kinase